MELYGLATCMHQLYYHNKTWHVDACKLLACKNSMIYMSELILITTNLYFYLTDFCDMLLTYRMCDRFNTITNDSQICHSSVTKI